MLQLHAHGVARCCVAVRPMSAGDLRYQVNQIIFFHCSSLLIIAITRFKFHQLLQWQLTSAKDVGPA